MARISPAASHGDVVEVEVVSSTDKSLSVDGGRMPGRLIFGTESERTKFVHWVRLLVGDLTILARSTGILIALSERENDEALAENFDKDPAVWNTIFYSVEHDAFSALTRIHDNGKRAILKKIKGGLSPAPMRDLISKAFDAVSTKHRMLLGAATRMRNGVFAHTSENSDIVAIFTFRDLHWNDLRAYWCDMAPVALRLERSALGDRYYPRFEVDRMETAIADAHRMFDRLAPRTAFTPSPTVAHP